MTKKAKREQAELIERCYWAAKHYDCHLRAYTLWQAERLTLPNQPGYDDRGERL